MEQQTAIDWLIEQLDEQVYRIDHKDNRINISISFEDMMALKKQAKQMEKEQIIKAIETWYLSDCETPEDCYNKIFNK